MCPLSFDGASLIFVFGGDETLYTDCSLVEKAADHEYSNPTSKQQNLTTHIETYLSDPSNLNTLDLSQISCETSFALKVLPCIPCLWKANTLSCKHTIKECRIKRIIGVGLHGTPLTFLSKGRMYGGINV